jgi:hypothetical protein
MLNGRNDELEMFKEAVVAYFNAMSYEPRTNSGCMIWSFHGDYV